MSLIVGDKIRLKVLRLGIRGEGVAEYQGLVVFVPGALPGEEVQAVVTTVKKNYGVLKLLDVLTPSPHRVKPPCPVFGKCGGCQLQHLGYLSQLEMKRQRVIDAFKRIGKFSVPVNPCVPSPKELHYRNKIQMPHKEGKLGLFAMGSNDLVEMDKCFIHCPLGEKVVQAIKAIHIPHLRYLVLKTAVKTQEVLVVLVVSRPLPVEVADRILDLLPEIKGVVQNLNTKESNVILSRSFKTVAGVSEITEEILGLKFKVSSASFFQVNPFQAENLYEAALKASALTGKEVVLDAFCGVGTLSLIMAQKASKVIGVEIIPQAIEDAKMNARRNGFKNTEFHAAPTEKFIMTLKGVDVVVLNPPRKGCDLAVLEKLLVLKPKKIVYISCDPATLARDLAVLKGGYQIIEATPFDMFPQTAHVETLVELSC